MAHPALLGIPPAPPASLRERGACRKNPELLALFFSTEPDDVARAKRICASCLVERACGQYAVASGRIQGVWGGTDERERRVLRRAGRSLPVAGDRSVAASLAAGGAPVSEARRQVSGA